MPLRVTAPQSRQVFGLNWRHFFYPRPLWWVWIVWPMQRKWTSYMAKVTGQTQLKGFHVTCCKWWKTRVVFLYTHNISELVTDFSWKLFGTSELVCTWLLHCHNQGFFRNVLGHVSSLRKLSKRKTPHWKAWSFYQVSV